MYILTFALLCTTTAWGYVGQILEAKTQEDITLTFVVTQESSTRNACRVGRGVSQQDRAYNYNDVVAHMPVGGAGFTIPGSVSYGDKTYEVEGISAYAFSGLPRTNFIEFKNPQSILFLGESCFQYSSLGYLDLSKTMITSVPSNFCKKCEELSQVVLPSTVTVIDESAFEECTSMGLMKLPTNLEIIRNKAFWGCTRLRNITFPSSLTTLKNGSFQKAGLVSIDIPATLTSISDNSFSQCKDLESITVDNGNPNYDSREACNAIIETATGRLVLGCKNTVVPSTVTIIGNGAFAGVPFESFSIPSSVTSIEEEAFALCENLTSFTSPSSVTSIGMYAFAYCKNLTSFTSYAETPPSTGSMPFIGINSSPTLYVPEGYLDAYLANGVWSSSFSKITVIGSIEFADENVKAICIAKWDTNGDGVLTTEEAAAVTSINKEFRSNTSIQSFNELRFFTGLTYISKKAFYGCSGLTSITIPKNVISIGNEAFGGCSALSSIDIPEGVTSIGEEVFSGCSKLTSITLPNTLQKIGYQAFDRCSELTSFVFPNSVTTIGGEVFNRCSNLKSVMFPESLTDLGSNVFDKCPLIESITIGGNEGIFESPLNSNALINKETKTLVLGCKGTVIPEDVRHIGNMAFYECTGLTSIDLPEGIETIGNSVFSGCTELTSIQLPKSLTSIGSYTFNNCSALSTITIPAAVTTIGSEAFYYCSGLLSVVSLSKTPATIQEVFWPNTKNITLYVPFGCSMTYRYAGWNGFKEIIEMEPVILPGDANDDGVVDVADVVAIVNYILEKPAENFNMTAADVNGDEVIDAADVVSVVNIILSDSDNGK